MQNNLAVLKFAVNRVIAVSASDILNSKLIVHYGLVVCCLGNVTFILRQFSYVADMRSAS